MPPLRSMQVFEAAVRHKSFTEAADELCITQSAVSRQVKELEQWLGCELFVRTGPNLKLTETASALGAQIGRAMVTLEAAIDAAKPSSATRSVTLSMLPSVAAKWLAPRLGRFILEHPDIDLRVSASRQLVDFSAERVDAAIRYGKGDWPGLNAELLCEEIVTPVCSPSYAASIDLQTPEDLLKTTLFHSDIEENWQAWFLAAGLQAVQVPRGPNLGDDAATLQAANDGQGVALGRSLLTAEDLAAGRLIAPFSQQLPASYSYWFVTPVAASIKPGVLAVCDWMKKEFLD